MRNVKMNVVVFGLGRIGLPIALVCAHNGYRVIGIDILEDMLLDPYGLFDCFISNPPFMKMGQYKGTYNAAQLGMEVSKYGVMIVPQCNCPFRYSGQNQYTEEYNRDYNKFEEKNLTLRSGKNIRSPIILECGIHYECKVSYKTKVTPTALQQNIINASYPIGDYHTLYYGEILSSYANRNIRNLL